MFCDAWNADSCRAGVLVGRYQLDVGKLLHGIEKTFFPIHRAGMPFRVAEQYGFAFATQHFAEPAPAEPAPFSVIRCNETAVRVRLQTRIDYDHRDAPSHSVLDRPYQRHLVQRSQNDSVDSAAYKVLDNIDLLFAIVFLFRPDPYGVDSEFLSSFLSACMDGFPELVSRPFRDNGYLHFLLNRCRLLPLLAAADNGA